MSLLPEPTASLHWCPFSTTSCLSRVKQAQFQTSQFMSKPHSLCRVSLLSVKTGLTFEGSASQPATSALGTCVIPAFRTSLDQTPNCVSQNNGRIFPKEKEKLGNTQECRNACESPNVGLILILILSVTLGTWDWTWPF